MEPKCKWPSENRSIWPPEGPLSLFFFFKELSQDRMRLFSQKISPVQPLWIFYTKKELVRNSKKHIGCKSSDAEFLKMAWSYLFCFLQKKKVITANSWSPPYVPPQSSILDSWHIVDIFSFRHGNDLCSRFHVLYSHKSIDHEKASLLVPNNYVKTTLYKLDENKIIGYFHLLGRLL